MRQARIRYILSAPLLLVALVIAYAVAVSLLREPCPTERSGWIAANLVGSAFALYFAALYFIVAGRQYMVAAMATLWAWHLLILWPFLATECNEAERLEALRLATGFGLFEFMAPIVLVALASSVALYFRYRRLDARNVVAARRFLQLLLAAVAAGSVVLSAAALLALPHLREGYSQLGADLPLATMALLGSYAYWIAFPVICIACLGLVLWRRAFVDRHIRIALAGGLLLLLTLNILLDAFAASALAPAKTLCSCL